MSLSVLLPFLYLLFGFAVGKSRLDVKGVASGFLSLVVIPLVIIYNIATYPPGLATLVIGVMVIMGVALLLGRLFTNNPVRNMCFFYMNIGWLGLPVASALFGEGAASVFIAAYIGSTVFGNTVGAGLLDESGNPKTRLRRLLRSPPIIAVVAGFLLMPVGDTMAAHLQTAYGVLRFLLGFIGMGILGVWLATCRIRLNDIRDELLPYLYRAMTWCALLTLFVLFCVYADMPLVTENLKAIYLLCLLPPAANIVVLETWYRKTGDSAKFIAAGTCISIAAIMLYAYLLHEIPLLIVR